MALQHDRALAPPPVPPLKLTLLTMHVSLRNSNAFHARRSVPGILHCRRLRWVSGSCVRELERQVLLTFQVTDDGMVDRATPFLDPTNAVELLAENDSAAKFAVRLAANHYTELRRLEVGKHEEQLVDGAVVRVLDRKLALKLRSSARAVGDALTDAHKVFKDTPLPHDDAPLISGGGAVAAAECGHGGADAHSQASSADASAAPGGSARTACPPHELPPLSSDADGESAAGSSDSSVNKRRMSALRHPSMVRRLLSLDSEAKAQESATAKNTEQTLSRRIHTLLNDPESSMAASAISIAMLVVILFSTVTMVLESMPRYFTEAGTFTLPWDLFEAVSISIFTVELSGRFLTDPEKGKFFSNSLNLVDLVAILPFYIELALSGVEVPGLAVLRVLRLARVLRLLTAFKEGLSVLSDTFYESLQALRMLVFFVAIGMIVFSSIMFYVERGSYDEDTGLWMLASGYECDYECTSVRLPYCPTAPYYVETEEGELVLPRREFVHNRHREDRNCERLWVRSPFQSIPESFWWCLVTMTTVGYGDIYPISALGKVFCMITAVAGLLVIALPISIVGSNFDEAMLRQRRSKQEEKKKAAQAKVIEKFLATTSSDELFKLDNLEKLWRAEVDQDMEPEDDHEDREAAIEKEMMKLMR